VYIKNPTLSSKNIFARLLQEWYYHSLRIIAKKIPLLMSGEEGWNTEL